jgi:transposase
MHNRILSIFGLQGLKVSKVIEYYRQIFIYVFPERKTAECTSCGKRSKTIHDYRKPSAIKHLKLGKRQTYLVVGKRRFFCKACQKPFTEKLSGINKWQRKTKALDDEIIESLREMSFASIKRRFGVNYKAQVKLLKHTMKPFEKSWEEEKRVGKPISIGIDEHSFSGRDMCITVTNLTTPSLKSILPDDAKKTLDSFFSNIPDDVKPKITSFCIDMKKMYKFSIKRSFPKAKVVIDHFHLIYDANHRIDEERRITQEVKGVKISRKIFLRNRENLSDTEKDLINSFFTKYPDLKFYWFIKESLRDMYKLKQKGKAQEKLNSLIRIMYKQRERGLTQWANTLEYWKEEILNFWDYRITNAYTEGIHTKLKLIKRIGFGFRNKEVYIRKAALACLPLTMLPHFSQ